MSDLLAARSQMGMSLAFHILFAVAGIGMPLLMAIAEGLWLKTGDKTFLLLAKKWAKGTAILFAVGAVSGTVLAFELGLLWPRFMERAGAVIGMPFSLEGFAFFVEAIFLGIFLYGWDKVPPLIHWFSGIMVAVSGALSGIFVVTANAWMNTPAGFVLVNGAFTDIHPFAAMMNPAAFSQTTHMIIASYAAIGFAVAGIHALMLLRDRENRFHRHAFAIALTVGTVMAILQPLDGDLLAKQVARNQPVKLAAMEGQFKTERGAPLRIGGLPNEAKDETDGALEIPDGLSFLAYDDLHAKVRGLDDFPRKDWPPVPIVHVAFQLMVGAGMAMLGVGILGAWLTWRAKALPLSPGYLWMVVLCGPLGFVAVETGWTVTEVGRQPWIIHGILRTADAVTPMPGLIVPFVVFTALYFFLAVVVVVLLKQQVFNSPHDSAELKTSSGAKHADH